MQLISYHSLIWQFSYIQLDVVMICNPTGKLAKWCKIHKVYIHSHSMLLLLFTNIFIHIQQPNLHSRNIFAHIYRCISWATCTIIRFQTKTQLFCSVFEKICVHTYRFRIVSPVTLQRRIWKRSYTLSAHAQTNSTHAHFNIIQPAKLARNPHGSVCPPFWILKVEWSGARSCLFDDVAVFR